MGCKKTIYGEMKPVDVSVSTINRIPVAMYVLLQKDSKAFKTYVDRNQYGIKTAIDFDEDGGIIGIEVVLLDSDKLFEIAVQNSSYGN